MREEANYGKRKTFDVLNKIHELIKFTPEGDLVRYQIANFFINKKRKSELNQLKEDEILHDLQRWGVLKIYDKERIDNEFIYYLQIFPKFEKIYLDHKSIFAEAEKETNKSSALPQQEKSHLQEVIEKWFNYKNNSISFYGDTYKPRREPQAKFIRQLAMKHQREKNNGTILKPGQRVSEKDLSREINLTIEQFRQIKKQLKRSFKDKGFPLKIDADAEGILLIYTI